MLQIIAKKKETVTIVKRALRLQAPRMRDPNGMIEINNKSHQQSGGVIC